MHKPEQIMSLREAAKLDKISDYIIADLPENLGEYLVDFKTAGTPSSAWSAGLIVRTYRLVAIDRLGSPYFLRGSVNLNVDNSSGRMKFVWSLS